MSGGEEKTRSAASIDPLHFFCSPSDTICLSRPYLVEDDEEVVQLAVQVAADGDLLADGRAALVEVGQPLEVLHGLDEHAGHVLGVQSVRLEKKITPIHSVHAR